MKIRLALAIPLVIALACASSAQAADLLSGRVFKSAFALRADLREISGVTPAGPNSVFAHNDEHAVIHEVSLKDGAIIRSFAFGAPTAAGDFEGVATRDGAIYLVASDGRLYEGEIKRHAARTRFNVYDTGVGAFCEIEGLAAGAASGEFFLLCKTALTEAGKGRLQIWRWSQSAPRKAAELAINAPLSSLVPAAAVESFKPSDLHRDAATGDFFTLSVSGAVVQIRPSGALVRYLPLDRARHGQPEGLAFLADGRLVIADEGRKRESALTLYVKR